jgi:hypothetical protein
MFIEANPALLQKSDRQAPPEQGNSRVFGLLFYGGDPGKSRSTPFRIKRARGPVKL